MSASVALPTGIRVLHHNGDAPPAVVRLLAGRPAEADPEREGARVLLAIAAAALPPLPLAALTTAARELLPQLRALDPALLADVASAMDLGEA